MTLPLFDLPGRAERGKRVERTEWGVRWLRDSPALTSKRGHITQSSQREPGTSVGHPPRNAVLGFPGGVRGSRGPHRRDLDQLVGASRLCAQIPQVPAQQHDSRGMKRTRNHLGVAYRQQLM